MPKVFRENPRRGQVPAGMTKGGRDIDQEWRCGRGGKERKRREEPVEPTYSTVVHMQKKNSFCTTKVAYKWQGVGKLPI